MTMRVLIFGSTGMLGHSLLRQFSTRNNLKIFATARHVKYVDDCFSSALEEQIRGNVTAENFDSVLQVLAEVRPDVVVNCIGIIKQLPTAQDSLVSISINALFPHRLALACKAVGARLIHISTDCVFSGEKGNYTEDDRSDADDLYGRSKLLGEVYYPHCVTLRSSIIGHELRGGYGLIDWFLAQEGKVRGFTRAIYSGFPSVEIARIIADYVIPNKGLSGLYHVSSAPVSKYDLLRLVAERYGKRIDIEPYDEFVCDRSLDSSKFQALTGYVPPSWPELVAAMHDSASEERKEVGHDPVR